MKPLPDARFAHCNSAGIRLRSLISALACVPLVLGSAPTRAADGCVAMLCFASPSWRSIPECVPAITQILRDLAHGKPIPSCAMGGVGNAADHTWASAPSFCPAQYTRIQEGPRGPRYVCDYVGAVSVTVDGALFARTWWTMDGDTSTQFSPAAKVQLRTWDSRFDDDYAAWLRAQPPAVSGEPAH